MLLTSILDTIRSVDKEVFLAINQWNSPFFDQVMVYISKTYTWFPVYALLIFLLFRNFGWKKALWIVIATLAVVSIADLVSVHLFKNVFQRLRPCHNPELAGLVHTDDGRCGGYYGFVSSHAANFMSIATFLFFFF
ncbi:MAG: phosphatase PAP2 family protein, partial [Bacteroidetes bacterium]|nr:phosphatase PAP2 family protein [Bacteroidota bacterium]